MKLHLAKFRQGTRAPEMYILCTSPGDGQASCKIWLAIGERRWCSNEAKTRNPLKFVGRGKLANRSQPLVGRSSPYSADILVPHCFDIIWVPPIIRVGLLLSGILSKALNSASFIRATLASAELSLSVCLSQLGVLLKRLNVGSLKQRHAMRR